MYIKSKIKKLFYGLYLLIDIRVYSQLSPPLPPPPPKSHIHVRVQPNDYVLTVSSFNIGRRHRISWI